MGRSGEQWGTLESEVPTLPTGAPAPPDDHLATTASGRSTVFLGEHQHTLDDKGRVILPARFRDRLVGGIVLAPGKNRCIDVYPRAEFERAVERMSAEVEAGTTSLSDFRVFASGSFEEVPDGQGRVTVPAALRAYADLDRELSVNGAFRTVEIWDRATWEAYKASAEQDFAEGVAR